MLEVDKGLFKERECDPEASTSTHNIECFDFSIHKFDAPPNKPPDRGARFNATMPDEVKEIRVERWVVTQCQMRIRG